MTRLARLLRLHLRRFWHDAAWASMRRWSAAGLATMVAFAALVAGLGHLSRSLAPPVPADSAASAAHPLDPLIAETAAEVMPPHWDWRLLKAMVRKESNYDPAARSPGGAVGLTQLLPATARSLGLNPARYDHPAANLAAGTTYLRHQYDRFHAVPDRAPEWLRTRLAIASYNAGPGRVRRALASAGDEDWQAVAPHLPASTVQHVERIVEEFYPSFAAIDAPAGRPRIGRWKCKLRFWGDT